MSTHNTHPVVDSALNTLVNRGGAAVAVVDTIFDCNHPLGTGIFLGIPTKESYATLVVGPELSVLPYYNVKIN